MTVYDYIENAIKPEGFSKPNYNKLYKAIAKVYDNILDDVKNTIYNFFPLLSDEETLEKHRIAFNIPKYLNEEENETRERIANAFNYLEKLAFKSLLNEYLDAYFENRYTYKETKTTSWRLNLHNLGVDTYLFSIAGFRIYIDNITSSKKAMLSNFLDMFLEADVEYKIFDRTTFDVMVDWMIGENILSINTFL